LTGRSLRPLLPCLALAACGGEAGGGRAVVRDSAGIAIVENVSPDDSAAYAWWRIGELLLDIGGEGAGPGQDLFRVSSARRLGDGSIVVANSGTSELRFFDADGALVRTAGRRGDGPGEFQGISWLTADALDTLLVFDARANRVSVLAPDGAFARDFLFGGAGAIAAPVGQFADGSFAGRLTVVVRPGANQPLPDGLTRPDIAIVRLDPDGRLADTIGVFPGAERFIRVTSAGGQIRSIEVTTPLFGRTPYHVAVGDELVSATQDDPEMRVFGADGALRRIVRTGRLPEPITDAHRGALIEKRLINVPDEGRASVRAGLEALPSAGTVPPYAALLLDREGNLWLADYDDGLKPPGRWTVYAADGRGLARITLPERFTPYEIGADWILGRELDDLDIEHVRLYAIARN
jgi:hypothetical protein